MYLNDDRENERDRERWKMDTYIWLLSLKVKKGREKYTNEIKIESMEKHACDQIQCKYYAATVTLCKQQIPEYFSE